MYNPLILRCLFNWCFSETLYWIQALHETHNSQEIEREVNFSASPLTMFDIDTSRLAKLSRTISIQMSGCHWRIQCLSLTIQQHCVKHVLQVRFSNHHKTRQSHNYIDECRRLAVIELHGGIHKVRRSLLRGGVVLYLLVDFMFFIHHITMNN